MLLENVIIPACVRGFTSSANHFEIDIQNGAVAHIKHARAAPDSVAIGILLPCLADAHVHIDKTYVVDEVGAADGDLFKAINLMSQHREKWTTQAISERMQRAIEDAYKHGTRAMRTHLDWPEASAPKSLAKFEALRNAWRGRVALQCVALISLDFFEDAQVGLEIAQVLARVNASCDKSLGEAALLGAFVYRNADMRAKLQRVFGLAKSHDLHLDFHVDEGLDVDACGLRVIAELTIANHYQGKVTCGHACSLSIQPFPDALDTLKLCAKAGIFLITLPSTNLYLQGAWDTTPVERGITRLKEAVTQGLQSSIATDNVADGFYPYGSYDLMDTYALGVQAAHLSPADAWLSTITTSPAAAMGLPWDGRIKVGCPADFVLLNAKSAYELISPAGRQRRVIRAGQFLTS